MTIHKKIHILIGVNLSHGHLSGHLGIASKYDSESLRAE